MAASQRDIGENIAEHRHFMNRYRSYTACTNDQNFCHFIRLLPAVTLRCFDHFYAVSFLHVRNMYSRSYYRYSFATFVACLMG